MSLYLVQRLKVFWLKRFFANVNQLISEAREVLIGARHGNRALKEVIVAITAFVSRSKWGLGALIVPVSETEGLYRLVQKGCHILLVLLGCAHGVLEGEALPERSLSAGVGMEPVKLLSLELNRFVKVKLRQLKFCLL